MALPRLPAFLLTWLALASPIFSSPLVSRETPNLAAQGLGLAQDLDWLKICEKPSPVFTPLDEPRVTFKNPAKRHPRQYLRKFYEKNGPKKPYGRKVARWLRELYEPGKGADDDDDNLEFSDEPETKPLREDAATVITMFYPADISDSKPSIDAYFARFEFLVKAHEQMVVYTTRDFKDRILKIRNDDHFKVITDFDSPWQYPNNEYQQQDFGGPQKTLFTDVLRPNLPPRRDSEAKYNMPILMAMYNAKAAIIIDAILHNWWGSDKFVLIDFGIFAGKVFTAHVATDDGQAWGEVLKSLFDRDKLARSIALTGNTGVVVNEYTSSLEADPANFHDKCWTQVAHQGNCLHFWASGFVGNALGMLNFAVRYMLAVDIMQANGWYVGREELVLSYVAAMWANTIFTMPEYDWDLKLAEEVQTKLEIVAKLSKLKGKLGKISSAFSSLVPDARQELRQKSIRLGYSTYGGAGNVAPINDPVQTLFCPPGSPYKPRMPNLARGKGEVKDDPDAVQKSMFAKADKSVLRKRTRRP